MINYTEELISLLKDPEKLKQKSLLLVGQIGDICLQCKKWQRWAKR